MIVIHSNIYALKFVLICIVKKKNVISKKGIEIIIIFCTQSRLLLNQNEIGKYYG